MNERAHIRTVAIQPAAVGGDQSATDTGNDAEPPEPTSGLNVEVVLDEADWSAFGNANDVVIAAARALANQLHLTAEPLEAVIALSSDEEVARLNGTYRAKPKPTNVLSFPAAPVPKRSADEPRFLGDIILARETILAEAVEQGIPARHHLQHLVIHGLLHLLGHDHETDPEAERMEALESAILASLNIANPYQDDLELDGEMSASATTAITTLTATVEG